MKYNILICDDDEKLCGQLESLLLQYAKIHHKYFDISVFFHGNTLLNYLRLEDNIDIMILDICLGDTNGIEIGKEIRTLSKTYDIPIIYISSFKDYAFSLFKIRPFDFLLKPVKKAELFSVLDELCLHLEHRKKFFTFKCGNQYFRIPYEDIMYFCSDDKKVFITTKKETMSFWGKLSAVKVQTGDFFLCIHKSYLINHSYVKQYTCHDVEMADGKILSISQARKKIVQEYLLNTMKEHNTL